MLSKIRALKRKLNYLNSIPYIKEGLQSIKESIANDLKSSKVNLGQIQSTLNNQKVSIKTLCEVEFQVFSQWGDDGIIQYLINKIDIPNKSFIEFGVENYKESNTRFLLINNNWSGYVIDGSKENIHYIKNDIISWAFDLNCEASFITKENINLLLQKSGFESEIGILSIDIDGVDYWVWEAIEGFNPVIVIAEYNSVFGKNTFWSVPYDPDFVRKAKHPSHLYYGVSLNALNYLAHKKGYSFIGCNSNGNNAYFIRNDKVGTLPEKSVDEGYVESKFREALINGERISGKKRIKVIEGMEVIDVRSNATVKIDPSSVVY